MTLVLAGCSATSPEIVSDNRDPYENTNRKVFEFNMAVDDVVLEPVARGYRALPDGVQTALTNHATWTSYPSTAVNSTFQGKYENAALATIQFLINGLTLGFADLTENDDDPEPEDFGQTMAVWNVPQGDYVVMPLLGPGTTRSHVGWVVDAVTNPLGFMGEPTADTIRMASTPTSIVTFRGNNYEQINDIKYNAIDPYAKTRSLYFQYRDGQIVGLNSAAPSDADKAFDDFLDEN
ncbi:MAG: VacJ family lipoprotein [Alphaproteobacteria bacterium]|nr:VacJ family lipoprotein [Alphaproteobacteria bacterium]